MKWMIFHLAKNPSTTLRPKNLLFLLNRNFFFSQNLESLLIYLPSQLLGEVRRGGGIGPQGRTSDQSSGLDRVPSVLLRAVDSDARRQGFAENGQLAVHGAPRAHHVRRRFAAYRRHVQRTVQLENRRWFFFFFHFRVCVCARASVRFFQLRAGGNSGNACVLAYWIRSAVS